MPPSTTRGRRDCRCPRTRHEHGTWNAYANDKCSCPPCRRAWAAYRKRSNTRRYVAGGRLMVPPVGVARRLQALACLGWAPVDLARELGCTSRIVNEWRLEHHALISVRTHAKVVALYDRLWDQPSPNRYALRTRRLAGRRGWLPPQAYDDDTIDLTLEEFFHITQMDEAVQIEIGKPQINPLQYDHQLIYGDLHTTISADVTDYVDEIAVERAIRGDCGQLTLAELSQARDTLERMGLSAREIGERLGMSGRTVQRQRAQERAA